MMLDDGDDDDFVGVGVNISQWRCQLLCWEVTPSPPLPLALWCWLFGSGGGITALFYSFIFGRNPILAASSLLLSLSSSVQPLSSVCVCICVVALLLALTMINLGAWPWRSLFSLPVLGSVFTSFIVFIASVWWEHVGAPGRITPTTVEATRTALLISPLTTVYLTIKATTTLIGGSLFDCFCVL